MWAQSLKALYGNIEMKRRRGGGFQIAPCVEANTAAFDTLVCVTIHTEVGVRIVKTSHWHVERHSWAQCHSMGMVLFGKGAFIFLERGLTLFIMCGRSLQDHGLPFMADERFAEDTLFFVAEEDWRCYFDDVKGSEEITAEKLNPKAQMDAESPADLSEMQMAQEHMEWPTGSVQESSQPPLRSDDGISHFRKSAKAKPKHFDEDTSPELVDMVKLCTAAHRCDRGDLVWLGWNPRDRAWHRKTALGWGSQLIAVSGAGARKMLVNFEDWFLKKHWDFSLKDALEYRADIRAALKASYVRPGIGTYETHFSGCTSIGERQADMESRWLQEGTRVEYDGQKHRDIVDFSLRGVPTVLRDSVRIPEQVGDDDLRWFTLCDKDEKERLATELSASQKQTGKRKTYWHEDLPAGLPMMDAEKRWMAVAIHHPRESKWLGTDSLKRGHRMRLAEFARRNFTEEPAKVYVC